MQKTNPAKICIVTFMTALFVIGSSACEHAVPAIQETPVSQGLSSSASERSSSQSDFVPLSFDTIGNFQMDQAFPSNASIPESARHDNGRKVIVTGEMLVTDTDAKLVDHFVLCDPPDVKLSKAPILQRQVVVYTSPDKPVGNHDQWLVRAYGTLEVGLQQHKQWYEQTVYRLRLDRLELLGKMGGRNPI